MTKRTTLVAIAACVALLGALALTEMAAAQTETVTVYVGKGRVLHRSGKTLILNVEEGEQGPGIRKFNIESTDGIMFKDRLGNDVQVFDLKKGDMVSAYRLETRPAPVTITMSDAEEIMEAEPAAPAPAPEPEPMPEPAPEPPKELPKTAGPLPGILVLGVLSLSVGMALRSARRRV